MGIEVIDMDKDFEPLPAKGEYHCDSCQIQEALSSSKTDSAERVNDLVDTLNKIAESESLADAADAKAALAEWRR